MFSNMGLVVCLACIVKAVILLLAAHGAPVLLNDWLGRRYALPIDFGAAWADGRPVFGGSKTWRGLIAACVSAGLAAGLLKLGFSVGACFGIWAALGDVGSSFAKRRLGCAESSRRRIIDRVPESLLPVWVMQAPLGLSYADMAAVVGVFFLLEEWLSPLLYKWHLRKRPY
ncbi:MAG: CDP-archaeol synthase [Gammaproteobacteria bacterium]